MQPLKTTIAVGSILQDRYRVEACLGEGGFSTVYLVQDVEQRNTSTPQVGFFALKELRNQNKQDRQRFLSEGEILMKLHHYALPRIYGLFEDQTHTGLFLLLEYIAGPNLETVRRRQPTQRFSLAQVLTIMKPIVASVIYLHQQQPPIIHRDIKPSNIVSAQSPDRTVLVDFGIAKEYETEATTTALRHCTPGYAAPEQYSGYGTDTRTDIYGLGATCYALLTGSIPTDAFLRTTTIVSKNYDPLQLAHALAPELPAAISATLARAMSIGQEQRFAQANDFWQALEEGAETTHQASPAMHTQEQVIPHPLPWQSNKLQRKKILLFLLLTICVTLGVGIIQKQQIGAIGTHTAQARMMATPTKHTTSPTTTPQSYPQINHTYHGTIYNIQDNTPMFMSLTRVQQQNERIVGHFSGLASSSTFSGVLDASHHIFFTVAATATQSALFFEGTIRADHNLAGNYCNQGQAGQCTGGYGLWSVTAD